MSTPRWQPCVLREYFSGFIFRICPLLMCVGRILAARRFIVFSTICLSIYLLFWNKLMLSLPNQVGAVEGII